MDSQNIVNGLRVLIVFAVAFAICVQDNELQAQQRTWTDASGHYELQAELVGVTETEDGLQAEFLMSDGKRMAILVSKLCAEDARLVAQFFEDSEKPAVQPSPDKEAEPIALAETPDAQPAKPISEKEEPVRRKAMPEDSIVSRPLTAPINMAPGKLDNRNMTDIKFDPKTAIRLDRDIERDAKGRPTENPIYLVDVVDSDLTLLPPNFRLIVDILRDSNQPIDKKRRAIEKLKTTWPQGRHPGLLKVLVNMLSHEDKYLRLAAIDLLANHDSDQSLIYIFARIDDVAFDVRWRAYEVLTQLRDPRVIPELCERLGGPDRTKAASVLQVFGVTSAPLVHQWIKDDEKEEVLLSVCHLLGNIGSESSVKALSKLSGHSSLLVRSQAKNSIKQINRRIEQRASNLTTRR